MSSKYSAAFFALTVVLLSCGPKTTAPPPPGKTALAGLILDLGDSGAVDSASVAVYDARSNAPVTRVFSDTAGGYYLELAAGVYYLKVTARDYLPSPPLEYTPVPVTVVKNDTLRHDVYLVLNPRILGEGAIAGRVLGLDSAGLPGILVAAVRDSDSSALSGVTGFDGDYLLFNAGPGVYVLSALRAGYAPESSRITVTLAAGNGTVVQDIRLRPAAGAALGGHITYRAAKNSGVDISLVRPGSWEAVPGLQAFSGTGQTYRMDSIPPGTYVVWASYRNDGYVMDPDGMLKSGLPRITVSPGDTFQPLDFYVTDAVPIVFPTSPPDSIRPFTIYTSRPRFIWRAYPAITEYVIEVKDADGRTIWGGFNPDGSVRSFQIAAEDTSVVFNFDTTAADTLRSGRIYRWKIYADDDQGPTGQHMFSSSEDLMGIFLVDLVDSVTGTP